jgi:salicylate hydroxylase
MGGAVTQDAPVLIAGGGIAGLSLAIALAQRGIASKVLERERGFTTAGAGIQLGPNATQILHTLGVFEMLAPYAGAPDSIAVCDGSSNRLLTRLPLGSWIAARHGAPYWVVHRGHLQHALLERVRQYREIEIALDFTVQQVDDDGLRVRAWAEDGKVKTGSCLIAADGLWSQSRKFITAEKPLFCGRSATRGVIARESVPKRFKKNATHVFLNSNAHIVTYPVESGRSLAMVAIRKENWREETWGIPVSQVELHTAFARFPDDVRALFSLTTEWRKWPLYEFSSESPWWSGRVALIGDAAHAMLPFLAQGGAMALEDAIVLAHHLQNNFADPSEAFARFYAERRERVQRVAEKARQNGKIYHMRMPFSNARNFALRYSKPEKLMKDLDWLYGWKPPA